jgi:predicted TIM-barrel fold metal-dependent hydrolase
MLEPSILVERTRIAVSGRARRITPILFGTDFYLGPVMYHYSHVLYEIFETPTLSEHQKQNIFWNNGQRHLRLEV